MEGFMPKGLRKGAWTDEEDDLLRKCIFKFGEGKWHQVPLRAGLNRSRKSCRMRWLNYLTPHIKRGDFEEDEVDLILKLHKLLGNRWSLIAGRIPGRTSNDIKNYWNTHFKRNKQLQQRRKDKKKTPIDAAVELKEKDSIDVNGVVFKPQPRTFSKTWPWVWKNKDDSVDIEYHYTTGTCSDIQNQTSSMDHEWWESLLFDKELEQAMNDHVHNSNNCLLSTKDDDDDFQFFQ